MARLKRHGHGSKRLCRRSRAARRSSEGGAPTAAGSSYTSVPEISPQQHHQEQVEINEVTQEEVEEASLFVFNFDKTLKQLVTRAAILEVEIDGLHESKELYDEQISNLKKATKSPYSSKVKQMRYAVRESIQLEELINDRERQLNEVHFVMTKAEVIFRSSVCVISQYADREGDEGSMIGYLAHIMRME